MGILRKTLATTAPCSTILIRLVVGGTFLSEGIQKFLFPDALGVGRFVKIGIPYPEIMAPFVGVFETVCGALLILGLLTRLAAIPMIVNISVAILSSVLVAFRSTLSLPAVAARRLLLNKGKTNEQARLCHRLRERHGQIRRLLPGCPWLQGEERVPQVDGV